MNSNKLTIKSVMDLVSWNTLTASLFPFLLGVLYSEYHFQNVDWGKMIIYYIVALSMDLIVNVLDNLDDYEVAKKQNANALLQINPIFKYKLNRKQVMKVVWVLILITGILGIYLVIKTSWILLLLGLLGLITAIIYSKIFQNLPVGELVSGLIMGFLIPFCAIYINTFESFEWSFKNVFSILLVTLPNALWVANMMLANNICDIEYDKKCGRITYPIKVGTQKALRTFDWFNVFALVAIVIAVILKLIPWTTLFTLLLIPYIYKECRIFAKKQDKSQTFLVAVKILAIASLVQCLTFGIGVNI